MKQIRLVADATLWKFFQPPKEGEGDSGSPLLLLKLEGGQLPAEFEIIPSQPPVEVNFSEFDTLASKTEKLMEEVQTNLNKMDRAVRRARTTINAARDSGRLVREIKASPS